MPGEKEQCTEFYIMNDERQVTKKVKANIGSFSYICMIFSR